MSPDEYCKDRTARSGSSFYYSFMFLPKVQRQAITALYAYCREVDDVVDECSDIGIARTKLDWWRTEIDNLYAGKPSHPVTRALVTTLENFPLPREHFLEIIDGMQMDLDQARYQDFKELQLYCYRVASVVGLLAAEIFGYKDRQTLKYAHKLGIAFQLTNILRDVREDASRGRIYVPLEELARFGVSEDDLLQSKDSDRTRALFRYQLQRAQQSYDDALALLPESDRYAQRVGLIMAAIYRATLNEIDADGLRILQHRISLTPVRKLWLAWRTSRQEHKRHRRHSRGPVRA